MRARACGAILPLLLQRFESRVTFREFSFCKIFVCFSSGIKTTSDTLLRKSSVLFLFLNIILIHVAI